MRQAIEHLKQQLFTETESGRESLLDVLYDDYSNCTGGDQNKLREGFLELRDCLQELQYLEQDKICCVVSALCAEQDRVAFQEGVRMGTRLIIELLKM